VPVLGKILGMMFPTLIGCWTTYELPLRRVWDKNLFSYMLGARPKQKWIRRVQ